MFEKVAEERTKLYMDKHTKKYNCENTRLETDNYNTGREYGYEDGFQDGAEFGYSTANEQNKERLTRAKRIIKELLDFDFLPEVDIKRQAEQFLEEK